MILAADIGGTKAEIGIFGDTPGNPRPLYHQKYLCRDFARPADLLGHFLSQCPHQVKHACLAVAGPVRDNRLTMTNIAWQLDGEELAAQFSLEQVLLINDLTALAMAVPILPAAELHPIKPGLPRGEMRAVIAPGTGLGEAMLLSYPERVTARGTEGGHCNFAPINAEQRALLAWMIAGLGDQPVNYEHLISGPGIPCLFDFCRHYHKLEPLAPVAEAMRVAKERTPIIVAGLLGERECPLCRRTIELFWEILGSEAGNLALKLLATGGVYLGGGILPRLLPRLQMQRFCAAFTAKAKMEPLLQDIPVHLILHNTAPLLGAAEYGRQTVRGGRDDGD